MPVLALAAGVAWAALVAWLILRAVVQGRAHTRIPVADAPGPDAPGVAVVVPARDEAATIGPCLDALTAQAYPHDRLSITVVNDGSRDATAAIVRQRAAADA